MNNKILIGIIAGAFVAGLFTAVYAGPILPTITLAGNTHTLGNSDIDGDLNVDGTVTGIHTLQGLSCDPSEFAQWDGDSWVCVSGSSMESAFPTSCLELLNQAPGTFDGFYSIDPDGLLPQPPSQVYCDMTTDGGGWTLVYAAPSHNQLILTAVYDFASTILFDSSTQALVGYRNSANALLPESAILDIPANWKIANPLSYQNEEEATTIIIDGVGPLDTIVKYGTFSFSQICDDPFTVPSYGRLCFVDWNAPFYSGFSVGASDDCVNSLGLWHDGPSCSSERVFTIAFR